MGRYFLDLHRILQYYNVWDSEALYIYIMMLTLVQVYNAGCMLTICVHVCMSYTMHWAHGQACLRVQCVYLYINIYIYIFM